MNFDAVSSCCRSTSWDGGWDGLSLLLEEPAAVAVRRSHSKFFLGSRGECFTCCFRSFFAVGAV